MRRLTAAAAYWVPPLSRRGPAFVLNQRTPKNKKPALPPAFVTSYLDRARLERGFQCGLFLPGNRAFHGRLHLLEGADLDLPHALARHAEFGGEVFQRHRLFRPTPRLEDAAFPGVEHADGAVQGL